MYITKIKIKKNFYPLCSDLWLVLNS